MPTIIAAIEPDLAHQTLTYDSRVADIVGDWEAQLDRAYTVFRAGNSAPLEVGDGTFRFRYTFRLRVPEHRDSLRTRLQDAMAGALIEIEPALRARLPTRTGKRRQGRGFAADADAHFKLANIVERIGSDWGSRLEEVCNAFDGKVACPEDFCSARVKSWSKVAAEVSVDAHLRGRVRSYIRYRLNWIVKNRQSSH
jgi:hypothetical protein